MNANHGIHLVDENYSAFDFISIPDDIIRDFAIEHDFYTTVIIKSVWLNCHEITKNKYYTAILKKAVKEQRIDVISYIVSEKIIHTDYNVTYDILITAIQTGNLSIILTLCSNISKLITIKKYRNSVKCIRKAFCYAIKTKINKIIDILFDFNVKLFGPYLHKNVVNAIIETENVELLHRLVQKCNLKEILANKYPFRIIKIITIDHFRKSVKTKN